MKPNTEKILTLHPQGKNGVRIDLHKYNEICEAIYEFAPLNEAFFMMDLVEHLKQRLSDTFDGSVPWYTETVKLDLEARGILVRIPGKGRHRLMRVL